MVLLDTGILVYAVGGDHPLRSRCRAVARAHADGLIEAATTIEVIQEFVHVRSKRRSRSDAIAIAEEWMRGLDLIQTDRDDLRLGLALFNRHGGLGSFDAVLAAVALNHGATALVSADRAFGEVPGLRWVDPASEALDKLIQG